MPLRSHALNETNYRVHVAPFFDDCPLNAITSTRLLELRAKLQTKTVSRKRRGDSEVKSVPPRLLSPRMVNLVMALVRVILRFAVANGHISVSPTERLGRGKLMLPIEKAKLAPPIDRPDDVGRVLGQILEARPDRFAFFATLLYTGMRKGEACGLRWSDIDLERRIINVRHSYNGPTKSGAHREVPIPAALVTILKAHKLVEPYQGEIVFPNDRGEMFTKNGRLRSHALNEMNYRVHVAPFFDDCPLNAITSTRLLELRAKLQTKTVSRKRRGDSEVKSVPPRLLSPRIVNW